MSEQNKIQIGGTHYKKGGEEHWDRAWRLKYDPFQYIITKWVERWKDKGGIQDLEKAQHALAKYLEILRGTDAEQVVDPYAVPSLLDTREGLLDVRYGEVYPSGWVKFVHEGSDKSTELYTCRNCRCKVRIPNGANPNRYHDCEEGEPGPSYVNQDS